MKKTTTDENAAAEELAAWEEWKRICSITGCPQKTKRTLSEIVAKRFSRMAEKVSGLQIKCPAATVDEQENLAAEFDCGLVERDRDACADGSAFIVKKAYKDWIWERIAAGDEPPLQCIRGLLLGRQGVLDRVVKRWIKGRYSVVAKKDAKGTTKLVFHESLDKGIENGGDDDGKSVVDFLPATERIPSESYREKDDSLAVAEWLDEIGFTYAEAVVMLAALMQFSVDSEEVKAAARLQHSAIAVRQQKAFARFVECAATERGRAAHEIARESPVAFHRQLADRLLELVRPEPDAAALVAAVEALRRQN